MKTIKATAGRTEVLAGEEYTLTFNLVEDVLHTFNGDQPIHAVHKVRHGRVLEVFNYRTAGAAKKGFDRFVSGEEEA